MLYLAEKFRLLHMFPDLKNYIYGLVSGCPVGLPLEKNLSRPGSNYISHNCRLNYLVSNM